MTFTLKLELSEHQFKLMSQALTDLTTAIAAETTAITALTSAVTTIPVGGAAGTPDAALVPLTAQVNTNAAAITAAVSAITAAVTPPTAPPTP